MESTVLMPVTGRSPSLGPGGEPPSPVKLLRFSKPPPGSTVLRRRSAALTVAAVAVLLLLPPPPPKKEKESPRKLLLLAAAAPPPLLLAAPAVAGVLDETPPQKLLSPADAAMPLLALCAPAAAPVVLTPSPLLPVPVPKGLLPPPLMLTAASPEDDAGTSPSTLMCSLTRGASPRRDASACDIWSITSEGPPWAGGLM